nr:MAG TPA: hypothetical protein [Caudoviricetes sp.]
MNCVITKRNNKSSCFFRKLIQLSHCFNFLLRHIHSPIFQGAFSKINC